MNIITVNGRLKKEIRIEAGRSFELTLLNRKSCYTVRGPLSVLPVDWQMQSGDRLTVTGKLRSRFGRSCRLHHVYIEASAIQPAKATPVR